ncbi:MAG TPA: hypothetical protein VN228_14340 [Pyrinomonadaceae bacterium]|nr:hypothetical protein [Pyrinomonadaceae bacterium]
MPLSLIDPETWRSVGYHAAVFVAVVVVLAAIQWLLGADDR